MGGVEWTLLIQLLRFLAFVGERAEQISSQYHLDDIDATRMSCPMQWRPPLTITSAYELPKAVCGLGAVRGFREALGFQYDPSRGWVTPLARNVQRGHSFIVPKVTSTDPASAVDSGSTPATDSLRTALINSESSQSQ